MSEMPRVALVFPGQGSQSVGMGRDLYEGSAVARAVFDQADAALGWSLTGACFEGPEEHLRDTAVSQPAILTLSIAALVALRERLDREGIGLVPVCVAGHSLGEFSALVAAGVLDFSEAIRLVGARGRLMKEAGAQKPGGMAAVIGLQESQVEAVCHQAGREGVVCVANYNLPGQTVISGDSSGLAAASKLATAVGARSVMPLAVSVANHSPLMEMAARPFADLVDDLPLRDAEVPLVANVTALATSSREDIRAELSRQMLSPVRWHASVAAAVERGATVFLEVGPGQVLTGLIKRATKDARPIPSGTLESIEKAMPLVAPT